MVSMNKNSCLLITKLRRFFFPVKEVDSLPVKISILMFIVLYKSAKFCKEQFDGGSFAVRTDANLNLNA